MGGNRNIFSYMNKFSLSVNSFYHAKEFFTIPLPSPVIANSAFHGTSPPRCIVLVLPSSSPLNLPGSILPGLSPAPSTSRVLWRLAVTSMTWPIPHSLPSLADMWVRSNSDSLPGKAPGLNPWPSLFPTYSHSFGHSIQSTGFNYNLHTEPSWNVHLNSAPVPESQIHISRCLLRKWKLAPSLV